MKKLIIILIVSLSFTAMYGQDDIIVKLAEVQDSLALSDTATFSMGDSTATHIMNDTLPNTQFVRVLVAEGIGGGTATTGSFADTGIHIYHVYNNTQIIEFDASEITAGNTRTITMPDKDLVLIDSADVENTHYNSLDQDTAYVGDAMIYETAAGLNIVADGGDEYIRLWDASSTASITASGNVTINRGIHSWTFTDDRVIFDDTDSLAFISDIGNLETYDPGSRNTADTIWIQGITSDEPNFDGLDTIDYIPFVVDSTITNEYISKLNISSANVLAGDSLLIMLPPGADKAWILTDAVMACDYVSATYASGATSYIKTGAYGDEQNIVSIGTGLINLTEDRISVTSDDAAASSSLALIKLPNNERQYNQAYWLKIGAGFTTGNSTFKLWVYFKKIDSDF